MQPKPASSLTGASALLSALDIWSSGPAPEPARATETAQAQKPIADSTPAPAPKKTSKKKPARSGGNDRAQSLPEVGQDELLGEQQPGDAMRAESKS